jgi:hypothetical protein
LTAKPSLLRVWTGIVLAALLCFVASLAFFEQYSAEKRGAPDPWAIARQQRRFATMKSELPPNSVLGYYSDVLFTDRRSTVAFFAVLYTLAPHLVADDRVKPQPEMYVGNLSKRIDFDQLERESGLKLVKDYGAGVVLLRRERQ